MACAYVSVDSIANKAVSMMIVFCLPHSRTLGSDFGLAAADRVSTCDRVCALRHSALLCVSSVVSPSDGRRCRQETDGDRREGTFPIPAASVRFITIGGFSACFLLLVPCVYQCPYRERDAVLSVLSSVVCSAQALPVCCCPYFELQAIGRVSHLLSHLSPPVSDIQRDVDVQECAGSPGADDRKKRVVRLRLTLPALDRLRLHERNP